MTLLSVNNISKTYQKAHKKAVSDVSFNVDSGDIVAFLGPNGAGKTTTLKMILNLVSPDKGTVVFDGKDVTHNNLFLLKNTGVLLEGSRNMYWALSPMENFVYWGGQRGLSKKEAEKRGETFLKQFGLLDKKYTSITRLSRGMQQVVGICCAMIAEPKLLILDEPKCISPKNLPPQKKRIYLQAVNLQRRLTEFIVWVLNRKHLFHKYLNY